MNKQIKRMNFLVGVVIWLTFTITSLMLVLVGARLYQEIYSKQQTYLSSATPLNYLTMKFRQNDRKNSVAISDLDEQPAIVLMETLEGEIYETWIYIEEGYLRELYIKQGDSFEPQDGEKVIPLNEMQLQWENEKLLSVTLIDIEDRVQQELIRFRCEQGKE